MKTLLSRRLLVAVFLLMLCPQSVAQTYAATTPEAEGTPSSATFLANLIALDSADSCDLIGWSIRDEQGTIPTDVALNLDYYSACGAEWDVLAGCHAIAEPSVEVQPSAGNVYVHCTLLVQSKSNLPRSVNLSTFTLVDGAGGEHATNPFALHDLPNEERLRDRQIIGPGLVVTGTIAFEVPENALTDTYLVADFRAGLDREGYLMHIILGKLPVMSETP